MHIGHLVGALSPTWGMPAGGVVNRVGVVNLKNHAAHLPWVLWGIAVAFTAGYMPYIVVSVLHDLETENLSGWARTMLLVHLVFPVVGLLLLLPALRRRGPSSFCWLVMGIVSGMMFYGSVHSSAVLGAGLIGSRARHPLLLVLGANVVAVTLAWFTAPIPEVRNDWFAPIPGFIGLLSATLLGMVLRGQQELADARVAQSRAEERARISREMHDSLAHRLSLISLHATVLESRRDLAPEVVASTARTIQTMIAEAGKELRQILHVLHDDGSGATPVVTWAEVERDLQRQRDGGLQLEVRVAPDWVAGFEQADADVRHAVLRTVEEVLSNARRHGDGCAQVDFEVRGERLVVRCVNRAGRVVAPGPGHGRGLPGLRERLRLCGGRFEVARSSGWFTVVAEFPRGKEEG